MGNWASIYATICYSASMIMWMASILYLLSTVLSLMLGIEAKHVILMSGMIVTAYTCLGGIKAVVWTDVLQSIILIVGTVFCAYYVISLIPVSFNEATSLAIEHKKFSLGDFSLSFSNPTFWVFLITGFTLNLQTFCISQAFVQRYIAAKSTKSAISSIWFACGLFFIITVLLYFEIVGRYNRFFER